MKCDQCPFAEMDFPCNSEIRGTCPPAPKASPPGLATMAGNLARAVVAHVADGGRIASPEVQAERKRICLANECGHCIDGGKGCTACGCGTIAAISFIGLDMDEKRSWASSRCPLDPPRWEAVSS